MKNIIGYIVSKQFRGRNSFRKGTLLNMFKNHNEEYRTLVGHGRSVKSYQRYVVVFRHLQLFLQKRGWEGIRLNRVSTELVREFERFLRVEEGLKNNTVWVYMITLKHILSLALAEGKIPSDPFAGFRNRYEAVDRGYLTEGELLKLMSLIFLLTIT